MEIREFAESILFSQNPSGKLLRPDSLTDDMPVFSGKLPDAPVRSTTMEPSSSLDKKAFPKLKDLEMDSNRAKVMHYFANHELLALEIMAICLLKFPEAPSAFRRGVVKAMSEEQEHMRLYQARMNELGLSFGEIRQNDYFWRSMADMKRPSDFCLKMGMTFEQANLDFSKFYLDFFKELGDEETSRILQTVYEDEISHVGFGLHWYKKLSDPQTPNLFSSHKKGLMFPLGLQRAKAGDRYGFDREARSRAGFPNDYIEDLFLFSASKERPSVVRYFNPFSEEEISNGKPSFTADKNTRNLQESLQHMLAICSLKQDIVLCTKAPSRLYLQNLKGAGLSIPEYIEVETFTPLPIYRSLKKRKIEKIEAWANCVSSEKILDQCQSLYRDEDTKKVFPLESLRKMNSQEFSLHLGKEFIKSYPEHSSIMLPLDSLGSSFRDEALALSHLASVEYSTVVKAAFGLSGRGVFFYKPNQKEEAKGQVVRILKKQESVVIEREFSRLVDFSLQIDLSKERTKCLRGLSRFLVGSSGNYLGGVVGRNILMDASQEVKAFWNDHGKSSKAFVNCLSDLASFLHDKYSCFSYDGILGVDCFLCEWEGGIRLKPIVEVNPRNNMGWMNVCLHKKIHSGSVGLWRVMRRHELRALADWSEESISRYRNKYPLVLERGLWKQGVFFASDPMTDGDYIAVVAVARSIADCEKILGLNN